MIKAFDNLIEASKKNPFLRSGLLFLLVFSLIIMFTTSCEEEIEPIHPIVLTGEIVQISANGVLLNGKITAQGSGEIDDYGFVWTMDDKTPLIESSYYKSLGSGNEGVFSAMVTGALVGGRKYNVRAYARSKNLIVYGQVVSFLSKGSKAPVIKEVIPNKGVWGDTIQLQVSEVSQFKNENAVFFGDSQADIISVNDSLFTVKVPEELDSANVNVYAVTLGTRSVGLSFSLSTPKISEIIPMVAYASQPFKVVGDNFRSLITELKIGDRVIPSSTFGDKIFSFIPDDLPIGKYSVSVSVGGGPEVFLEGQLEIIAPDISDVIPMEATWGDTVEIIGPDFSSGSLNTDGIFFGDFQASIVSKKPGKTKVIVPTLVNTIDPQIKVRRWETEAIYNKFRIIEPKILNVSPSKIYPGDTVIVSGEGFHPTSNLVLELPGEYVFESKDSIVVIAAPYIPGGFKDVSILSNDVVSNSFPVEIIQSWNRIEYFPGLARKEAAAMEINGKIYISNGRGTRVLIGGSILIAGGIQDMYQYDPMTNIWNEVASPPISADKYQFFSTSNFGYIIRGQDLWRYDPNSDSWSKHSVLPDESAVNSRLISFSIGNKGYILIDNANEGLQEFWEYDEQLDMWTEKNKFIEDLAYGYEVIEVNGKGYLFTTSSVFEYDPIGDSWSYVTDLPIERSRFVLASDDTKAYLIGGYTSYNISGFNGDNRIFQFDPVMKTVVEIDPGPFDSRYSAAGVSADGKVYFGSGDTIAERLGVLRLLNDFWVWDPELQR